nr:mannan endo-1,4-beta-mannosidase a [Quercus suber]
MKPSHIFSALLGLASQVAAAPSFAGSNLYYAAGLDGDQQTTLFQGLSDAGIKVVRVWLDGEKSGSKGTTFATYPSLEGTSPGDPNSGDGWNDQVLDQLDDFMANANGYGIKVLVSFYSYNALENTDNPDFYHTYYGTGDFYTNPQAIQYYKNRIAHVMNHVNPHNGKSWSQSSEYIFAFETQNEAMHDNCEIAGAIKDNLGGADILVSTGGGSYVATSLQDAYFSCDALDVLAIHAYGVGDLTQDNLAPYVTKAQNAGKKLLMQEWGACAFDTSNNDCPQGDLLDTSTRDQNIATFADNISKSGIPWMYWQIIPNADPHDSYDYEIGVNQDDWDAFKSVASGTSGYDAAFDFSNWLL